MPEAIEVRKFADIISANVLGHKITHINILKGRYTKKPFEGYAEIVKALPLTIDAINTKGKFTYITLSNKTNNTNASNLSNPNTKKFYLFNTLGLSGGWTLNSNKKTDFARCENCNYMNYKTESSNTVFTYPIIMEYITEANQNEWFQSALKHLNVEFITDIKTKSNSYIKFYFCDQLSFGTLKAIDVNNDNDDNDDVLEKKLKELGPDLLDDKTTFELFREQIRKKVNNIKSIGNVIVNQKIVSGVGNYLRADALWMAKISPFRKVSEINDRELENVYRSIKSLMLGDYDYIKGVKLGFIDNKHTLQNENTKLATQIIHTLQTTHKLQKYKVPKHYHRNFFVYKQDTDIYKNVVIKTELYEGSQKRYVYWVDTIQK